MKDLLKKIFNWKVFSVCYLLLWLIALVTQPIEENYTPFINWIGIISFISFVFGMSLCFAVGWKKKLYTKGMLISLTILSVISCIFSIFWGLITYDGDINRYVLYNLLFYLALNTFPMVIAFFVYLKQQNSYELVNKPVFKFVLTYIIFSGSVNFLRLISLHNTQVSYNLFDYISIFANIITLIFLINIALGKQIRQNPFIKTIAIYCIFSCLIPIKMYSTTYLTNINAEILLRDLSLLVFQEVLNIFIVFVLYRYVFQKNN